MAKSSKSKCMFVNLADKLAVPNQVIIHTMDELIERALLTKETSDSTYQNEVKTTARTPVINDLKIGPDRDATNRVPRPKSSTLQIKRQSTQSVSSSEC